MSDPTVAIVSPGAMGAAIGARLVANGVNVVTPSGRSDASEARARAAGMTIVTPASIAASDFIFSIVPPGDALRVAEEVSGLPPAGGVRPLYIDWNAVAPERTKEIGRIIERAGGRYADGSIVGMPPGPEGPGPRLYASGAEASALQLLEGRGVLFKVMDAPVGAASALKMAYAGITKGTVALGAAMLLAAKRAGADEAVLAELASSQAAVLASFRRSIPDMFGKAQRWVPELHEIADFVGADHVESGIYRAMAGFYAAIAKDADGSREGVDALAKMLKA
jgi:L-threonate 2-dehydrogenase